MAAVVLEVVLSDADIHDTPRQDRRLGCGHREARRRHIAAPIVPLQDHRAPAPQPLQRMAVGGTHRERGAVWVVAHNIFIIA